MNQKKDVISHENCHCTCTYTYVFHNKRNDTFFNYNRGIRGGRLWIKISWFHHNNDTENAFFLFLLHGVLLTRQVLLSTYLKIYLNTRWPKIENENRKKSCNVGIRIIHLLINILPEMTKETPVISTRPQSKLLQEYTASNITTIHIRSRRCRTLLCIKWKKSPPRAEIRTGWTTSRTTCIEQWGI